MKSKSCVLLVAHGSRAQASTQAFWDFTKGLGKLLPGKRVEGCFLELADPKLSEQLDRSYQTGIRTFFVFPVLLFPGRHLMEDIPRMIADFKVTHTDTEFHFAPPLGSDPELIQLLAAKARVIEKTSSSSSHSWKRKNHGRRKKS